MTITKRLPAAVLVAAALALVTGCGGGRPIAGPSRTPSTGPTAPASRSTSSPSAGAPRLEFRRVLADGSPTSAVPGPARLQTMLHAVSCVHRMGDLPRTTLGACDRHGIHFLLAPAAFVGGVEDATAREPSDQTQWVVDLTLDPQAAARLATFSSDVVESRGELALVLDDRVLAAATVGSPITDGAIELNGLTESEAQHLAASITAG